MTIKNSGIPTLYFGLGSGIFYYLKKIKFVVGYTL